MGNSNTSQPNPEIRALVHQINAYLNSKSTILYQISLLKLKLNSRSSYSDGSEESKGIAAEIAAMPNLVETLREIAAEKLSPANTEPEIPTNVTQIFEIKDKDFEELELNYLEVEKAFDELVVVRDETKFKLEQALKKVQKEQKMNLGEIKEKCGEIVAESENLNTIILELKEKLEFLQKKKAEALIKRGNKRKTFLGMSIINKSAMDLKSRFILKQELIKTIHQTKAEQDAQLANFESRNKLINMRNENIEEEEMALNIEMSQNKDKIIDLEWEIEKLVKERNYLKRHNGELSMNLGDKTNSNESEQGSFGSSLASLLNGFGDYRLEKEAIAEENLKLKQHVQDIISIKRH